MPNFIYKYELPIQDEVTLRLPAGAKLLSVQVQRGSPQVWALVERNNKLVDVTLAVLGTGHLADQVAGWEFLGTIQLHGGELVFHVFVKP